MKRVPGSFRDPSGQVFIDDGKVYRTVNRSFSSEYEAARSASIYDSAVADGYLVGTREVPLDVIDGELDKNDVIALLEHDSIPYVSYPYEWSFEMLKNASIFHLRFHQYLLDRGFTLSDSTAYNIQFCGARPVFIDALSIVPYEEGSVWTGYQQFFSQFLNPLLLTAKRGVPFNSWYRGSLEGIGISDLVATLNFMNKFDWRVLTFLLLYTRAEIKSINRPDEVQKNVVSNGRKVPLKQLKGMLVVLEKWIGSLSARSKGSVWASYAIDNTYDSEEYSRKKDIISEFVRINRPKKVFDLGCNSGDFSALALSEGAEYLVGFDFDHQALAQAEARARLGELDFLPLWLDASNPSPGQGWLHLERDSFQSRGHADAVIALAFEHHLAIGKNIPLEDVIRWIVTLAPIGLIEFVPKEDPTVQVMLANRKDIFPNYDEKLFEKCLGECAYIESKNIVSSSGRAIYQYAR